MKKKNTSLILKVLGGILVVILLIAAVSLFYWKSIRDKIIEHKLKAMVVHGTDSLYSIKYDSLQFDEVSGSAYLKNIHIIPDTQKIKSLDPQKMPYIFLDVQISSITVSGMQTQKALAGKKMVGDSVVIEQPEIKMYSLKPLHRETKIESEAKVIYKEILGNMDLIKLNFISVKNVHLTGFDFYSKEKNFEMVNGKILLEDLLIDSAHNRDTNRVLFCRKAAFNIDSFSTYNNGRIELGVRGIKFSGIEQALYFDEIKLHQYATQTGGGTELFKADTLRLTGVNTNEVVKNKNIIVDSIICNRITLFEPVLENLKSIKIIPPNDSTGFRHVYSIDMKRLSFPKVNFVPNANSNYSLGNISLKINEVKADQIIKVQMQPLNFSNEVELALTRLSLSSKDKFYRFIFNDITLNSSRKQLDISSFNIIPFANENQFAARAKVQQDRYDVALSGIALKNISMEDLLRERIIASALTIKNTTAKIYRDLEKPLDKKSKVGKYPSQLLKELNIPVNISQASLTNAYIEYKEKEVISGSPGIIKFTNSNLNISNITNIPEVIRQNSALNIDFQARALGEIPLQGRFKFLLNSNDGNFVVNGSTGGFDALTLNQVSMPMAMLQVISGNINSIEFNLTGDNNKAQGDFVMKYENLNVDILKKDKNSGETSRRGFASLVANLVLQNNNPGKTGLRKAAPVYERDIYKSFFNLVWKTVFTGMKETVGMPK